MVQEEIINIVKQYLNNLKAGGFKIQFAYIYGSYARNEATPTSDIDVLLVGDDFDTTDDLILSKPWLPRFRNDFRIEPVTVGTKRFQTDTVSPIVEIAKQEGFIIHP
jgi:predicted nucleotidyltransferase